MSLYVKGEILYLDISYVTLYIHHMATQKQTKKQDKITFQPDSGYREIMNKALKTDFYGPKRSLSFIINEALKQLFIRDGFLSSE